jgi:hypothetical protein
MELNVRKYREGDAEILAKIYFESVRHGTKKYYSREQREAWAPSIIRTRQIERHGVKMTNYCMEKRMT